MHRLLALAGTIFVAGCAAPMAPSDPRVFLTPDAAVSADPPIVTNGPLLRASIRLVNPTAVDRPVVQTTDWLNAAGMPLRSLASAPQRLTVPRFGDATIQLIAPNPAAIQFRTRVEPDRSAIDPN